MHPHYVFERAKAYINMVLLPSTKQPTSHRCPSNSSVPKWMPPLDGWLMINVDASIFKHPPHMGVGAMIRNHAEVFKMAFCKIMNRVEGPELAEALAV